MKKKKKLPLKKANRRKKLEALAIQQGPAHVLGKLREEARQNPSKRRKILKEATWLSRNPKVWQGARNPGREDGARQSRQDSVEPWKKISTRKNPGVKYYWNTDPEIERILREDGRTNPDTCDTRGLFAPAYGYGHRQNPKKWGPSLYDPIEENPPFREPASHLLNNPCNFIQDPGGLFSPASRNPIDHGSHPECKLCQNGDCFGHVCSKCGWRQRRMLQPYMNGLCGRCYNLILKPTRNPGRSRKPDRAAWMMAYETELLRLKPEMAGHIKWDELLYPFMQGWDAAETARRHAGFKPTRNPMAEESTECWKCGSTHRLSELTCAKTGDSLRNCDSCDECEAYCDKCFIVEEECVECGNKLVSNKSDYAKKMCAQCLRNREPWFDRRNPDSDEKKCQNCQGKGCTVCLDSDQTFICQGCGQEYEGWQSRNSGVPGWITSCSPECYWPWIDKKNPWV